MNEWVVDNLRYIVRIFLRSHLPDFIVCVEGIDNSFSQLILLNSKCSCSLIFELIDDFLISDTSWFIAFKLYIALECLFLFSGFLNYLISILLVTYWSRRHNFVLGCLLIIASDTSLCSIQVLLNWNSLWNVKLKFIHLELLEYRNQVE